MGKPTILETADFVYLRCCSAGSSFSPAYSGPYRILSRRGKVFELLMGNKKEMVTVDRLKLHTGTPLVVAVPKQPGRLPEVRQQALVLLLSTWGGGPVEASDIVVKS